jgi:hypothetical protein
VLVRKEMCQRKAELLLFIRLASVVPGLMVLLATVVCGFLSARSKRVEWLLNISCYGELTLVIHWLVRLGIGRVPLVVGIHVVAAILGYWLLDSTRRRRRVLLWLIADGRKLDGPCTRIGRRRLRSISWRLVDASVLCSLGSLAVPLFFSLALLFLLLLPRLPFFPNLFEFYLRALVWFRQRRLLAKDPTVRFRCTLAPDIAPTNHRTYSEMG